MKKKIITIYLVGVLIGWVMGFSHMKRTYKVVTYGDIAFCTTFSLFSWLNVAALTVIEIENFDFWDKPI